MIAEELVSPEVLEQKNELENDIAESFGEYVQQKAQAIVNEGKSRVRNAFNRGYIEGRTANSKDNANDSYKAGMRKAWEIAFKLTSLTGDMMDYLFDGISVRGILSTWTPEDVEKQFAAISNAKPGDEVMNLFDKSAKFFVTSCPDGTYSGVASNGQVFDNEDQNQWIKTGAHAKELTIAIERHPQDIPF